MKKKTKQVTIRNSTTEFLLYKSDDGDVKVDVLLINENIWMPQKRVAELFGVQRPAITKHFKKIFDDGELDEKVVSSVLEHTTKHGAIVGKTQSRSVKYYNLDAIISVGYRVNSNRAVQFRIWANKILKEYIIKGFAMDDERLKDPKPIFGKSYFKEQLDRIRDIRSSERMFYQQITDIYAQCSIDYDKGSDMTKVFFATVQNKLHWAITGNTAAEIISARADSKRSKMGLTSWKNSPDGPIRKCDVVIAKNYLSEPEIKSLNRIVTMYLDYAEHQAEKNIPMTMNDWVTKLNAFLKFNEEEILQDSGKVTAEIAKQFAESEFEKYRPLQDKKYISDFDRMVMEVGDSIKDIKK